ncbi:NAD(P)/FAD-dependent oxidoreductase [Robbsia andropogonis]|uniref:NAD(P)/FAD-dependent oxidoreductase n=1 Tax=Robbsia andropogonis TaxID=28092 RepID=UPI003D22910E
MPNSSRIVIVGGGIAGLLLATKLGDSIGRLGKAHITLVDKSPTYVWKPMLHTIAAGTRDIKQQQVTYLAHAREHHFDYQPGEMVGLNRHQRVVRLGKLTSASGELVIDERTIPYDVLVIAVGSQANDFGIPGVREHCFSIDSQAQAEWFNEALRIKIFQSVVSGSKLRVSIVGAGATGVELSAELSRLMELAAGYGDPDIRARLEVTLIESAPRVLAAFPSTVSALAEEQLRKIGFNVKTHTRVSAVDADGLQLGDGSKVPAQLMVWAAGVKGPDFLGALDGITANKSNQIAILPTLQSISDDKIFVLGDCSTLSLPGSERPLAPTAQVATQQAKFLAQHLPDWLDGRPLPNFVFRDLGSLVSLSEYNAFGTLGQFGLFKGGFIKGRFAQLSHAMLYRQHQQGLHGFRKASLLWTAERINGLVQPKIRLS